MIRRISAQSDQGIRSPLSESMDTVEYLKNISLDNKGPYGRQRCQNVSLLKRGLLLKEKNAHIGLTPFSGDMVCRKANRKSQQLSFLSKMAKNQPSVSISLKMTADLVEQWLCSSFCF